ncbi:MAG: MoaD/ThiS family protein [Chloroflexi bacterium]|nr:MoaD/ThiS family protein [Chloroflexota bacterium]
MRVRVKLFASFREAARQSELALECPAEARVADALGLLQERFPQLRGLGQAMLAVNLDYVGPDFRLHEGDELALIPPVSGGGDDFEFRISNFELRTARIPRPQFEIRNPKSQISGGPDVPDRP